jgi:FtsP/CotA-like multicopper oxidase with cupredoxin domain
MAGEAIAQQVPLAPTAIPQFVQELPRLTLDSKGIPVVLGTAVDVSMCEFQTSILPVGTPVVGAVAGQAPPTWVWGYQNDAACNNPGGSYIGPVVIASRGTPTQMTYWNKLPDATTSSVTAYSLSTDQTLQWADPFSLLRNGDFGAPPPEKNDCNLAVKQFHDGVITTLPAACLNNYGFLEPQLPGAVPLTYTSPVPAAPHLHGGEIPASLDGGPDAWWTPNGIYGHGYYSKNQADALEGKAVYTYPNVQDAAPTWFHDHVLGATRLNVYAGIAGAYYQVDPLFTPPTGMTATGLLNGKPTSTGGPATEELLIPLVIQDRMFDTTGQLFFPAAGFNLNLEHPFWVPEFVGDVIVVNGKAWPKVTVEPKRYRFLVLNGSNARTYELFLANPITKVMGPAIWVIGNDQGFLEKPVQVDPNALANNKLVVMPGERYEIIIDFAGQPAGTTLVMRNTARTPYPGGATASGSTTGRVVQFVVGAAAPGFVDNSYNPAGGTPIRAPLVRLSDPATGTLALKAGTNPPAPIDVNVRRQLTLNEVVTLLGPIEILMNNTTYTGKESWEKRQAQNISDFAPVTTEWNTTYYSEQPQEGQTEIWEIVNLTADAHPIHPHLVAFQILNRQAFDFKAYDAYYNSLFPTRLYEPAFGPPCNYTTGCAVPPFKGKPPVPPPGTLVGGNPDVTYFLKGPVKPPSPAEQGWKDTAISYPGEVLRLLIRFAPTHLPNTTPAADAFYEFNPSEGHGYVWHCHIIDHEDNEMMRPFNVIPNNAAVRNFIKGTNY